MRFLKAFAISCALASAVAVLPGQARAAAGGLPPGMSDLVATLLPEVVNISIVKKVQTTQSMDKSASPAAYTRKRSLGSGFIVDPDGIIVTNSHVIDGADEITVILQDNTQLKATLIYKAPIDMALLKVQASRKLPAVKWGDSDRMRPGDTVIAIGNPLGLGSTVTSGIVSALDRDIKETPYDAFIQTDAAINHGNSGGPLFNTEGEVIGINTALYSPGNADGGSVGLGFAIPGNDAQFILNNMKANGRLVVGWLGATLDQVTQDMADSLGMPDRWGAIVSAAPAGTPAGRAGLQVGDVITRIGKTETRTVRAVNRAFAAGDVGERVGMEVWRDGAAKTIDIKVEEPPEDPSARVAPMAAMPEHVERHDLGLDLATLDDALRARFGIPATQTGVVVTAVVANSVAAERGIVPGDVLVKVQLHPVATPEDVNHMVDWAWDVQHRQILLMFQDEKGVNWVTLPVGGSKKPG